MLKIISLLFSLLFPGNLPVFAKEQHSAHVHGKAKLDIAVEGTKIALNFESPAESIYGFEHEAKSAKDVQARDDAAKILKDEAAILFLFEGSLKCQTTSVKVEPWSKEDHDENEKKGKKGQAHGHEHGEHGEVHASYTFQCSKNPSGSKLIVALISKFPKLQEIAVQLISDTKQTGATFNSTNSKIDL